MDRRTVLALAAIFPAVSAAKLNACSVASKSPRSAGFANNQVLKMFEAWFERDREAFESFFTQRLMANGEPMEEQLASELVRQDPLPAGTFDIFAKFFADKRKTKRVTWLVSTDAATLVACAESDPVARINPDCSGMPKLHLFAVQMAGLNPKSISHIASAATPDVSHFSLWSEGRD